MQTNKTLYVEKKNICKSKIVDEKLPALSDGEVLLKIKKYALTSNNVTYAVTGFLIKYWDFFPAEEPWGVIPVWGFAEVCASKKDEIKVGELVYGYFPMSQYLKISAGNIRARTFMDAAPHRREMAPIYNTYNRLGTQLDFPKDAENFMPILKPLFVTSFLISEFLKSEQFFNAKNIIITSASSKTALGLGFMLAKKRSAHEKNIIGLTSEKNIDFVKETNLYNEVLPYSAIPDRLKTEDSIIVDMAGNSGLLWTVYEQLGEQLKHVCKVGLTNWSAKPVADKIPVARFFFAPTYAKEFFMKHGLEAANEVIHNALYSFIEKVNDWIEISPIENYEALQETYHAMVEGDVDPGLGYVVMNEA